jgi:tRNA-modifying protein YgfZ
VSGDPVRLRREEAAWLRQGATLVPTPAAIFRIRGPGAVECLQGLLTNDVARPGPGMLGFGALLSPKGMILVDCWVLRHEEEFVLTAPVAAREAALDLFRRRLPPRLARLEDLSEAWHAAVLIGTQSAEVMGSAALPWPEAEGQLLALAAGPATGFAARATAAAPWRVLLVGAEAELAGAAERLQEAGALIGSTAHREAARILAGWPALGREISEKTLPQEVRFDELGGVSYTKGCYIGQETVARVHFRGHPNRLLRGLVWSEASLPAGTAVTVGDKGVGVVSSVLEVGERRLGLAVLRREVATGALVTLDGGQQARAVGLPFPADLLPA